MKFSLRLFFFAVSLFALGASGETPPFKIDTFPQEIAHPYGEAEGLPDADVSGVEISSGGAVFAATEKGLAYFSKERWQLVPGSESLHWRALGTSGAELIAVGGETLYGVREDGVTKRFALPGPDVNVIAGDGTQIFAGSDDGLRVLDGEGTVALTVAELGAVTQVDAHGLAVGTGGAYRKVDAAHWERLLADDGEGRAWGAADVLAVAAGGDGALWLGMKAGLANKEADEKHWRFLTGREGLPYNVFSCAALGPEGDLWLGTDLGAVRYDGKEWSYRQGRTWLPDDEVRDIAVDASGGAWIATADGIGYIERKKMTLAEKADYYENEFEKYIARTEYGYLSGVALKHPGDRSSAVKSDTDNDGLWTSMYGAGECYAYGATKSPESKARAKRAFEALRFLQKVTQGGEHAPPKGYVARTIRSIHDKDPNIGRVARDTKEREERDTLWKVYEPRWPKSADGEWYWKSDTSSDELDGHYFFYPLYHDLVADTEEEKERVREVVRDLTDHMIDNNFALMDHDGTPTRWAIYGPDALNKDQLWWAERGINSLSMLAYLAVAQHVTGDEKYHTVSRELIEKHHYLQNLNFPKLQWGPGTANQSDDEMAVMSFYNLIRYTKDDEVRDSARYAFYRYWTNEFPEMNPFFNFAYAAVGVGESVTDQWGTWPLSPWEGWLDDSMATLCGLPLDRVGWGHQNSHRTDITFYAFANSREPYAPDKEKRGYRVNGKVLPAAERSFGHWNTDPWHLDYRGNGKELESGEVFLLPYYMGLYHGFIEEAGR